MRYLVAIVLLCAAAFPARADERPRTGIVVYPLQYNLNPAEGTVECWVQMRIEPADFLPAKDYTSLAVLLSMSGDRGGMSISSHIGSPFGFEKVGWYVRFSPDSQMLPLSSVALFPKHEWHHLALVWDQRDTWLYIDGQMVSHRTHPARFADVIGDLHGPAAYPPFAFYLGDRWNYNGRFAVDELRLSTVARKPEELGFHGELQPDPYTALLDKFDQPFEPDGKTRTTPTVILDGEGGLVHGPAAFVEGKFGMALSLLKPEAAP